MSLRCDASSLVALVGSSMYSGGGADRREDRALIDGCYAEVLLPAADGAIQMFGLGLGVLVWLVYKPVV